MAKFVVAMCLLALIGKSLAAPSVLSNKITLPLQKSLQAKSRVNIFVSMREGTTSVLNKLHRGAHASDVYNALSVHAVESQKDVIQMLNSPRFFAIKVQSFWITNQIYVQGADQSLIESLATMHEVSAITEEEIVHLDDMDQDLTDVTARSEILAEWNIEKIQTEQAWAVGGNGAGGIVGMIDTGARVTHEALRDNYKNDAYSWYDPYGQTQLPADGNGHGSHTTGIAVGSNGIGVAPGAKWMACKGLQDNGSGTQSALLACGQFMTCPDTPTCMETPHVVSNSWGGGNGATWFDDVIRAWHQMNIVPVFGIGASGNGCRTIGSPADSQVGVLGIGAVTSNDGIASFSGRGPSNFGEIKPNVCAPAGSVRSAGHTSDNAYVLLSGTSNAGPHVAGLVGLLKSRRPLFNYATIKNVLETTADRNLLFTGASCEDIPDNEFPNHIFGYGRINALNAMRAILAK